MGTQMEEKLWWTMKIFRVTTVGVVMKIIKRE